MVKKPEPPLLSTFDGFGSRTAIWLGTVEASDERDAIQSGAREIQRVARERGIPVAWLIARRR